jgi:hypothetical protein
VIDLLAGFIQELRAAGLPVSLTENLDAMEAVKHIPIEDREAFKFALAATLVKNNAHWRSFETVFEVYFSLRGPQYKLKEDADADELWRDMQDQLRQGEGRAGAGGMESLTPEELAQLLYQALMNGDAALLRALARQAVSRYAGMEPGRPVGGTYYLYRPCGTSISTRCRPLMEARAAGRRRMTPLRRRPDRTSTRAASTFRQGEAEIRRRLVADCGVRRWPRPCAAPARDGLPPHALRRWHRCAALYPLTAKLPPARKAPPRSRARPDSAARSATRSPRAAACGRAQVGTASGCPELMVVADIQARSRPSPASP